MDLFNTIKQTMKPSPWFAALFLSLFLQSSCVGGFLYLTRGGPHAANSKRYILGDTVAFVADASLAHAMIIGSTAPTVGWVYLTATLIFYVNNTSKNL